MYLVRRRLVTLVLIAVLLPTTLAFGPCNKQSTIKAASEAAKDIGGGLRDVIRAVDQAYTANLITLQQKDNLAALLKKIAQGGQKGVEKLAELEASGADVIPADKKAILNKLFDDEVVGPFLNLLTQLGQLSESSSIAIRAALVSVRTAIVLLSSKIGRVDVIEQIKAREAWNV